MVLSFSKIFYLYWTRTSIFAISSEHFVLGNYREGIWNVLGFSLSLSLSFAELLSPTLMPRRQEMQPCSTSSTMLQLMLQQGVVVVRLHNLISSPPILGLSPGNDTMKWARWGQKGMPLLSYLLCGFYVCSQADSTAWNISCEVICLIVHLLLGFITNSEHVSLLYY